MSPTSVVGCILTLNEEANIARAINSLLLAVDEVVVVDSQSDDRTREIAEKLGATVLVHPFESYPAQRNWAIDQIAAEFGDVWMLSIDADEWLSNELGAEIRERAPHLADDADVYVLKCRLRFDGRVLRHGGFGGTWLTRLVPVRYARYEDRKVNEHIELPPGARVGRMIGPIEHGDVDSWSHHIDKHNRYSTLEAVARIGAAGEKHTIRFSDARRDPSLRRRLLRERVWNRLPARPAIRFTQIYIISGGFLDGRAGFRRALFEAWQEMMTDLKAEELARAADSESGAR